VGTRSQDEALNGRDQPRTNVTERMDIQVGIDMVADMCPAV
jgi:hypothetical protein